jgi:phosphohistidine swiveling domain-containing protein
LRQRSPLLGPLRAAVLRFFSRRYGQAVALREEGKSLGVRITAMSRAVCLEVAGRLIRRGTLDHLEQIFFLERGEMAGLLLGEIRPESLRDLVHRRREQAARWEAEEPPPVICGDELRRADDGEERPAPDEGVLTAGCRLWRGLSVSAGRAAGRARVLLSPVEGYRLQPGEVLVAPSTDPAWTPIFLRASALVLEIGGLLSHGAIVAREYGLPAVANLPEVTRGIPDGAWVEVDGNRGEVRVGREGP